MKCYGSVVSLLFIFYINSRITFSFKNIESYYNIDLNDISKIEGRVVAETEKAVLIQFKSEKQCWVPKSTLYSDFDATREVDQMFSISTWVLEKNKIIIDEDLLVKIVVKTLADRHSDNLITIYGIGSFFDKKLPVELYP